METTNVEVAAHIAADITADYEQLLAAKDRIIEQQEEQIELLKELAETRRLNLMFQTKELAEHRDLHEYIKQGPWRFALYLLINDVWPFSVWYHRFE
jgi:hypothetical protein